MSFLILALPEPAEADPALDFVLLAGGEVVEAGQAPAAQLPRLKDPEHEVVALVPAQALSWHSVQLPPGVGAQSPRLRAVLEGLLEDELLDPPSELHLALAGPRRGEAGDGPQWVAACERRWLAMSVQQLEAAGCRLSRVLPEWGPPAAPRVHVTGTAMQPQMVLCSSGSVSQLALNPETLAWALPPAGSNGLRWTAEPELLELARQQLQHEVLPWPRSERWAAAALPHWDLSQGLLKRRRAQRSPLEWFRAPRWRTARWALLGVLAVNLVGFNALAWSQSVHLQSRREQMRQMLLQTFPQASASDEPAQQMQREFERLRAASRQASASDLPVVLGAVLQALPPQRVPQGLDYAGGQLSLRGLELPPPELAALTTALRQRGYQVAMQGSVLQVRVHP